jgi:putative transposase
MKERKKYSKEEKLRIVQEAEEQGVKATLDKYGIYPATYCDWKRKVEAMGEKGLEWVRVRTEGNRKAKKLLIH